MINKKYNTEISFLKKGEKLKQYKILVAHDYLKIVDNNNSFFQIPIRIAQKMIELLKDEYSLNLSVMEDKYKPFSNNIYQLIYESWHYDNHIKRESYILNNNTLKWDKGFTIEEDYKLYLKLKQKYDI